MASLDHLPWRLMVCISKHANEIACKVVHTQFHTCELLSAIFLYLQIMQSHE
jgi:hypothetical protein